jgi:hypothetical protein
VTDRDVRTATWLGITGVICVVALPFVAFYLFWTNRLGGVLASMLFFIGMVAGESLAIVGSRRRSNIARFCSGVGVVLCLCWMGAYSILVTAR